MLRSKTRVASLTAVVLITLVAVYPSICFLRMNAQEPAKAEGKIKELQKERLAAVRGMVQQDEARFKAGEALPDELLESTRMLADAELEVCASDKERVTVMEKILATARNTERVATDLAKRKQGRESTALKAKAERLRFEIALERAKGKVAAKPGDGPQPPANIIQPNKGGAPRVTTQSATTQAYESVRMFARVSGFLKVQSIDIGDRVKRGQVLAVVDVPELEAQLKHDRTVVDRERSRVEQAKSRIRGAEADLEGANLVVKQADATAKSAAAGTQYREKQWKRMKDLFNTKSIEERLVDETKDRYDAALETERSTKAAVAVAKAHVLAGDIKIEQARTDIAVAEADVKVSQAKLEKSQVYLSFATIVAPFDGIVTQRGYAPGDFIQSAENRKKAAPLMTLQRTDLLRVTFYIPDRDVPFLEPGDAAEVEIDAFPGKKFQAKVSRMAAALDPKTRSMRVEIDLPNLMGQIRPGMSGTVTTAIARKKE